MSIILLEGVLQVAALFIDKKSRFSKIEQSVLGNKKRIVMMGDSNTYGLYLKESESYPAIFDREWNEHHPDQPVEVINLGFPGTDSSRVLKSLPNVIETFQPDIITVMIGVNDFWTVPANIDNISNSVSATEEWLNKNIRLYKLLYMLKRELYNADKLQVDGKVRDVQFDPEAQKKYKKFLDGEGEALVGDKPQAIQYGEVVFDIGYIMDAGKTQNPAKDIKRNMSNMASIAKKSGVQLIFITYAYFEYPQKAANWQMKAVSKEESIPLINATKLFRAECKKSKARCEEVFFPDYHPRHEGYQIIALGLEKYFFQSEWMNRVKK